MPTTLDLNNYEDVHQMPLQFSFECIHNSRNNNYSGNEKLLKIIESLCPANLDEFEADGSLFMILSTCLATLISSYNKMKSRYGF